MIVSEIFLQKEQLRIYFFRKQFVQDLLHVFLTSSSFHTISTHPSLGIVYIARRV
jgi:hypothetical protein